MGKRLFFNVFVILLFGVLSFSAYAQESVSMAKSTGEGAKANNNQTIFAPSSSLPTNLEVEVPAKVKFKTGDDKIEALVVKDHGDHETIEVNLDGNVFVMKARSNKPGSRKYKEATGAEEKLLIAEVKTKGSTFKLVDENDRLLWKIKISGGKVKISDNEENNNAFVLKKDGDKVKVKDRAEKEIARVKYYPDNGKLKLKDAADNELYISKEYNKLSGAIGVMALKEIPAKLRAVIASELVKKGY